MAQISRAASGAGVDQVPETSATLCWRKGGDFSLLLITLDL